ncbi:MAG TPA: chalcone isomerase family protein [Candidatus Aquabacterium excrementipullorum]|nr:chalcone isomerase family protein [Candidatus Aquabacterium excrementipullorum]
MKRFTLSVLTAAALALSAAMPAQAVEVGGVKLEDSQTVAGKNLVLNGAGLRVKAIFKVYALGLYLPEKKNTTDGILALQGPKRFKIVMLRDLSGEEFGQAFLTGINKNLDKDEKAKFVNQLVKLGDLFEEVGGLKKGDTILGDWNGSNTTFQVNGKTVGTALPDPAFYNAILKIWLGASPADSTLKPALLGEKE